MSLSELILILQSLDIPSPPPLLYASDGDLMISIIYRYLMHCRNRDILIEKGKTINVNSRPRFVFAMGP